MKPHKGLHLSMSCEQRVREFTSNPLRQLYSQHLSAWKMQWTRKYIDFVVNWLPGRQWIFNGDFNGNSSYTNSRKKHKIYPIKPKRSFQGSQSFCYSYHIISFFPSNCSKKEMDHRGKSHLLLHSKNPYIFSNYAVRFCATHCCKAGGLKENTATVKCFLGWRSPWLNSLHIPVDNQAAMTSLQRSEGNWFCGKGTVVDWLM